jgi:organic radical activating enzyme
MKYSDFISLQDYFHPVFNLQNEASGYWEKFIPTSQFNILLEKTLDAVSSNLPANRKSIWVQGTFGTGKSHAGAVIKHLLCDDVSDLSEYIDCRIDNSNLKNRLIALRKDKRFFSVVLSGVEGAYNPHTFALTLQRTIKETLRNAGHKISVNSDFENAIELIENKAPYIKELIDSTPEVRIIAKTKEEILKKLRNFDIEFYLILEEALQEKYSVQLSTDNLSKWLSEIETEIRNKDIADGLLIFWDEFTSILDTISNGAINILQKIAELSEKQNIYLYLISHRNTKAYGERADEIKKMQDRFHIIQYNMEAITTYHIMAATLKKSDVIQNGVSLSYDMIRDTKMHSFDELISYLTDNSSQQSKDDVKNLFPLHPYTAFLCSTLADHIGSANRSVFNFMYDSKNGFLNFLQDEGAYASNRLLTANCLWDFFLESFMDDSIKYGIVTETYHAHINNVTHRGIQYAKVFKGILLLNAMRNTFEKEQVLPSSKNIRYLFSSEDFEDELDTILEYLDKNQIVQKDPSDNFLITFSSLPATEINEEKKRAEAHYKDALTILEFDPSHKQNFSKWLDDTLIRCSEYCFLSCLADEYFIKSRLNKEFKQPYSLHIALFFAMDEEERLAILDTVARLAKEDFQNVLFVVFTESLNDNMLQRQRFLDYVATQTVAKRHNSNEQAHTNQKNANQIVLNWLNRLRQGNCTLYFNINEIPLTANNVAQYINQNIIFKIFSSGLEIMQSMRQRPTSFYKQQNSQKSAEIMLCAIDRNDAEKKFSKGQYSPTKFLFKDDNDNYIVEQDLQLKSGISTNHPLILVQNKVDELLRRAKQQHTAIFNLGQVLSPLTEAPFGLYSNIPNVALLAFALRKYQKELYNAEVGVPITADNLRDRVMELFSFWQNGKNESKLRVRFGSKEEKELIDTLIAVFDLRNLPEIGELSSIKNVRWGIAYYCKHKSKYPLWCLKFTENALEGVNILIDQIVNIVHREDTQTEQIKQLLKSIKEYQHDLQRLLLSKDTFEKGFRTFVNGIESVTIENNWWDELSKYLSERMGEEIGWWKEADVESKIKDFYIRKMTPAPQFNPKLTSQSSGNLIIQSTIEVPVSIDKVNEVRNKITQTNLPTPALKWVLVQVLDNFPQTADLIKENLE